MVIWIIGLAGSGKTHIGKALYTDIKKTYPATVFIDGDSFRKCMGNDLGHTEADRVINAYRICEFCKLLDDQNINVVCSILSFSEDHRKWCRNNLSNYYEIFLDVSLKTLKTRNQKNLYQGHATNVVGIDIPFEHPKFSNLVLTDQILSQDTIKIVRLIKERMACTHEALIT